MTSTKRQRGSILQIAGGAGLALGLALVITGCGSPYTPASGSVGPPVGPATVSVTPATATLHRGETQQFTAQVMGRSDQTVAWSVPDGYGSIDSTGLYTAPVDIDGGDILVTATSNADPTANGTATVTLPAVTFSIAPNPVGMVPGTSLAFSATVVGLNSTQVSWSIQGTGGGTISSAGLYTAPANNGIFSVLATSSANANYSATATVLVAANPTHFSLTGAPQHAREFHTAALLPDGTVLVAGGSVFEAYCLAGGDSAELYDPLSGLFAPAANMTTRRYAQASTLLQDGEVLITGGFSFDTNTCFDDGTSPVLTSAELYDPAHGSFTATGGSMAEGRGGHTATLLLTGKVLVAGGGKVGGSGPPYFGDGSITAELYDPNTGIFTATGNMTAARVGQTATLLANGEVLIAGGLVSSQPITSAELYNPLTGAFTVTGSMTTVRAGHTATLLQDGRVLMTGGFGNSNSAEIYDPATHSFVATGSMATSRWLHTATLLPDGTVLVVGGETADASVTAEIYDPLAGSFQPAGLTESQRAGHSATLLLNGKVLVVGGVESPDTAELYP